ncbi:MAG: hypothetical protein H8E46_08055 [FCB group bacterium]|nr:hypothetical protein [FCB group bacterium]
MRGKILISVLGILISGVLFAAPRNILEDILDEPAENVQLVSADEAQFDPAWTNYKNAFAPVRDAIVKGDYRAMRPWLNHLKDASLRFSKANIPERYGKAARKIRKEILKGTKALLKAAKSGNREKIQYHYDHLKDSIDRMDQLRMKHS